MTEISRDVEISYKFQEETWSRMNSKYTSVWLFVRDPYTEMWNLYEIFKSLKISGH